MNLDHKTWEVGKGEKPPEEIRRYLKESNASHPAASEVVHKRKRKFLEGRISPDGDVYVYGPVQVGPAEDAPKGTVRPYVGSGQLNEEQDNSNGGFSYGLAGETDVFTFSNTGERGAQRTLLRQAALLIGIGVVFVAIGVGVMVL